MTAQQIINQAKQVNKLKRGISTCKILKRGDTIETLIDKLLSDEGLAFARQTNFPSIDILRAHKDKCTPKGIFVDASGSFVNAPLIFLCGKGKSKLAFNNQSQIYNVYLMHGAEAEIFATGGAVVQLFNISGGEAALSQNNYGRIIVM